jgi:EPS-associated MarR family transcriptional regulator
MRLLDERPQLSQRELASSLRMSVGKANYCLRALIEKGFVKAENYRNSGNKLAYLYLLTPAGATAKAELTRRFLSGKLREYAALRLEIKELRRESGGPPSADRAAAHGDRRWQTLYGRARDDGTA